jgi:hypothetical protein
MLIDLDLLGDTGPACRVEVDGVLFALEQHLARARRSGALAGALLAALGRRHRAPRRAAPVQMS